MDVSAEFGRPEIETTVESLESEIGDEPVHSSAPSPKVLSLLLTASGIVALTGMAILGVLQGGFGDTLAKLSIIFACSVGYGALAFAGVYKPIAGARDWLATATFLTALLGLTGVVPAVLASDSDALNKLAGVTFIIAFATAHITGIEARRNENDAPVVNILVRTTYVFVSLAGLSLCALVIFFDRAGSGFYKTLVIVSLLDIMLNALVPIVRRTTRRLGNAPKSAAS